LRFPAYPWDLRTPPGDRTSPRARETKSGVSRLRPVSRLPTLPTEGARSSMTIARNTHIEQVDPTTTCIHLSGTWRLEDGLPTHEELERWLSGATAEQSIRFDTEGLDGWDSSLVAFVVGLIDGCRRRGVRSVDESGLPEDLRRLVALVKAVPVEEPRSELVHASLRARLGGASAGARRATLDALGFIGEAALAFGRFVAGRSRHRPSDFYHELEAAGARALPIMTVVGLLVGMIVAFVGGVTLHNFGATIYVADLLAIGVVRELGALMTAIVMAGRTGSAYAAEIGSMRVSGEIDALVTMGISPIDFVVFGRLLALSLMMPLLCVYADFLGVLGGGIVAAGVLGLPFAQYLWQIQQVTTLTTFAIGVGKSVVFGMIVAMSGCLSGLRAGRSAAEVGNAATSAVVNAIVWTIVADGAFAVVFFVLGV
jgi:phospholipid/cholesterol/gamma-HCH transport system permease protein